MGHSKTLSPTLTPNIAVLRRYLFARAKTVRTQHCFTYYSFIQLYLVIQGLHRGGPLLSTLAAPCTTSLAARNS